MRKYYRRRLIRIMIPQYLMVSNYHVGISNDKLIQKLNMDLVDTMEVRTEDNIVLLKECKKSSNFLLKVFSATFIVFAVMVETNEQEIIERFVRTSKTLVTWKHLSTVFGLWAIGMGTAGIVFIVERFIYWLSYKN